MEVVVAFVIFAISAAAVNEVLFGALRRSLKSADEAGAMLVAQSLRDERAAQPAPWPESAEGETPGGWLWRMTAREPESEAVEVPGIQAQELYIEVWRAGAARPLATLRSIELTRRP